MSILMLAALPCLQLIPDVLQGEQLLLDLLYGEQLCIAGVELGERGALAVAVGEVLVVVQVAVVRRHAVEVAEVDGMGALLVGEQRLIHLLTVPDADGPDFIVCAKKLFHRLGKVSDGASRRLLHQDITSVCMLVGVENQIDGLVEGHDEARHGGICYSQWLTSLNLFNKEGHYRTSRTKNISVSGPADEGLVLSYGTGLGNKDLLHHSLAGSHGIDWIGCLVGGETDDFFNPSIDAGGQHVVGADDVGLHCLHGKELTGGNLFQSCCTEHKVHTVQGIANAAVVTHIPDVVLDLVILVEVAHVILFLLVATEDADLCNIGIQEAFEHGIAKGAGSAGD